MVVPRALRLDLWAREWGVEATPKYAEDLHGLRILGLILCSLPATGQSQALLRAHQ